MKFIPILFTFDQKLLIPAAVCITSLLENAEKGTFYDIFILHGKNCDFSALNRLKERYNNFNLTFREVKGEFVGAYIIRDIPETAYYRLIAPELIPEYDKFLYSDVDVIFREDLAKYYDLDLGKNYFGGVDNCASLRPYVQDYVERVLKLNYTKGYFYSGNLIINSKQILKDNKLAEFRELGKHNFLQQDMDIINIACNGRFFPLGPSFCLTNNLYNLILNNREEMESIYGHGEIAHALSYGIVHYNGSKPWSEACLNMDIWWNYYRKSIFFDERFCHDFWEKRSNLLQRLTLLKRVKLLLRYPLDRKTLK